VTTMGGGGGGRTELRTLLVWFALAKDGSHWWEEVDIQVIRSKSNDAIRVVSGTLCTCTFMEESLVPSLSSGVVGSRFVSQDDIESAKARRDEQWKAAYARSIFHS